MLTVKGKTMIISGGVGAKGLAVVRMALEGGMQVAILSGFHQKALGAIAELDPKYGDQIVGFAQDPQFRLADNLADAPELYTEESTQEDVLNWISDRFGGIDVVVNGTGSHERHNLEDTDRKIWRHSMDVMEDAFFNTKAALPHLKKSDSPRVINLTTCDGRSGGWDLNPSFAAARGGLISLTYEMARELGPFGITVNAVATGHIEEDVPDLDTLPPLVRADLLARTPLGRVCAPRDVAGAIMYLASDEASFVTGTVIDVNGGVVTG
ncbi:SDR family oxidoreductase [Streptomyces sp. NPDC005538]|uniref:SDR family NAD(P)-dependent oxidoreductase n=1 Tax=unclassified Streptomyces TaxID=2593676 RepID=UPI0033ABFA15